MRWRVKIAIGVGIVFIATILISVIHHYQLKAEVNAYIAQLKAQGEPMDLAQVLPPTVPVEQNDAPSFLKATAPLETNWDVMESNPPPSMRIVIPGRAMVGWAQPDIRESDGTNSWDDLEAALDKERDALDSVLQITNCPQLDFNLSYASGFDHMKFTSLVPPKKAAQVLSADAMLALHRGDTDTAVRDTHAMLLLANAMQHDRLEITELVRVAIANIAITKVWEILQTTNVTDGQLAELQSDSTNFDFVRSEANALEMERAVGELMLARWRGSSAGLQPYLDLVSQAQDSLGIGDDDKSLRSRIKVRGLIFLWRYWWSYPDELRYLKGYEASLNAVRSVQSGSTFLDAIQTQNKTMSKIGISSVDTDEIAASLFENTNFRWLMSQTISDLGLFNQIVMRTEVAKQLVTTAIALKRYQIKNASYPATLDELVHEFLPSVPLDPVDGKPLRYRLNADGTFLLYSVGPNGKDDGGNPSNTDGKFSAMWPNRNALDWVWPQPATAEEVQNYYKHPPK
jgi:hypothetical protein